MSFNPGDVFVGGDSQYIQHWRNGVKIADLDTGYSRADHNTSVTGIVVDAPRTFLYACVFAYDDNTFSDISGYIQKFASDGTLDSEIVAVHNFNNDRWAVPRCISIDGDGNLVTGWAITVTNNQPNLTFDMLQRHNPNGTQLDAWLSTTVSVPGTDAGDSSSDSWLTVSVDPVNEVAYYNRSRFNYDGSLPSLREYLFGFDMGIGTDLGQIANIDAIADANWGAGNHVAESVATNFLDTDHIYVAYRRNFAATTHGEMVQLDDAGNEILDNWALGQSGSNQIIFPSIQSADYFWCRSNSSLTPKIARVAFADAAFTDYVVDFPDNTFNDAIQAVYVIPGTVVARGYAYVTVIG